MKIAIAITVVNKYWFLHWIDVDDISTYWWHNNFGGSTLLVSKSYYMTVEIYFSGF